MKNVLQHLTTRTRAAAGAPDEDTLDPVLDEDAEQGIDRPDHTGPIDRGDDVEVRRNGTLAAVLGAVAGLVALAYLLRAVGSGSTLDWVVFAIIGTVALAQAATYADSRTPLLVADRTGIRLRLGRTWQGLPWDQIEEVEHAPRHTLLRDGRLVAFPVDADAVLASLDPRARRQAAISERLHGAPFAVPLGVTTRVVGGAGGLTAALVALAPDPELVVEVVPEASVDDESWAVDTDLEAGVDTDTGHDSDTDTDRDDPEATDTVERPRPAVGSSAIGSSAVRSSVGSSAVRETIGASASAHPEVRPVQPVRATSTPSPLRQSVAAIRTEVTRRITGHHAHGGDDEAGLVEGSTALARQVDVRPAPLPEAEHLRRDADRDDLGALAAGPDDTGVWRSATVVISETSGPAVDPVIGPQLARARQALGLDVERLAERTRIRAHVIEAIEVDDFEPCGGDFYARGHLRTLARVLGVDATPLLVTYDESYADAPIDPRRVFEAELATGSDGAIRSLRSGANWSVVVAAVMALVLAWSVARLVVDRPDGGSDAPSLKGDSAGLTSGETALAPAVPVVLTAQGGGAKVVVRDGAGAVVFKGSLAFGQSKTVKASPPVRVQTSDGSLTVGVAGQDPAPMGRTGRSARNTFVPPVD